MALSSLLGQVQPVNLQQAQDNQLQQQLKNVAMQGQMLGNQSAEQDIAAKRRAMGLSLFNGVLNEPDPVKQQELAKKIVPIFNKYVPDMQLDPENTDISTIKTLAASQIPLKDQMTLDMEQQRIDQGKYTPVKDMYGSPTGFMDTKTGEMKQIPGVAAQAMTPPVDAGGNLLSGDAYLKTLPADHAAVVKAIGEGRMQPPSGYALTKPLGQKIMADVSQAYPDFNANAYGAVKEWNTGKLGNTVRSLNVANDHLDTLANLATALQNGDTKALNALSNTFRSQFGQTAPANFEAAKGIVADEVVKAVVGSGGALGDREEAKRNIMAASSPEQLAGVISTYKNLMRGQLHGLQQQYETSTGKQDFLDRLSPKTRQEIMAEQGGALSPATANAPKPGAIEDGFMFMGGDPSDPKSWKAAR